MCEQLSAVEIVSDGQQLSEMRHPSLESECGRGVACDGRQEKTTGGQSLHEFRVSKNPARRSKRLQGKARLVEEIE